MITTKDIGDYGEKLAAKYLRKKRFRVLEKNYRSEHGEIDIIVRDKTYIVFCEVKTRKDSLESIARFGRAATAVDRNKRMHILYTVKDYLRRNSTSLIPRIDIIEVYLSPESKKNYRIEHIENAFGE